MKVRDLMQRLNVRLVCNKVEDMEVKVVLNNNKVYSISEDGGTIEVVLDKDKNIITIRIDDKMATDESITILNRVKTLSKITGKDKNDN